MMVTVITSVLVGCCPDKILMEQPCFTCGIVDGSQTIPGDMPIWQSSLVVANHHDDTTPDKIYSTSRAGWVIVSPVRHVTRVFDLSGEEWGELGEVIRSVDCAVTELFGSKRTMVASLGWHVDDHVHFHCVPTFDSKISLGSQNFESAYVPPKISADDATRQLANWLQRELGGNMVGDQ